MPNSDWLHSASRVQLSQLTPQLLQPAATRMQSLRVPDPGMGAAGSHMFCRVRAVCSSLHTACRSAVNAQLSPFFCLGSRGRQLLPRSPARRSIRIVVAMDGASEALGNASETCGTELGRVVAVHEGAKAVLSDSHHVNLRALDAMVRSLRAGAELRGFAEVSEQMRQWSRELHAAVQQVTSFSADQVGMVSASEKRRRLVKLLSETCREPSANRLLAPALERAQQESETADAALRQLRRRVRATLEDLQQLGLMAMVLSSAALIEAAAGGGRRAVDLTIVSKDFAERSEKVTENIRRMLLSDRQAHV